MRNFIQAFKAAWNIDLFDLNFSFGSEKMCRFNLNAPPSILTKKGYFIRCVAFFLHLIKSFHFKKLKQSYIPSRAVLFFVGSKNQKDSLYPLVEKLDNIYFVGDPMFASHNFSLHWAYIMAIPFIPLTILRFSQACKYQKESFRFWADYYCLTYGYYIVVRLWLIKLKPKAIVFSNDHNMENRVVMKVAKELGISTVYLQHASIDDAFPPLFFDYALLDGMDALKKYVSIGESQTKVFLIGTPKFDTFFQSVKKTNCLNSVAICTNGLDNIQQIEQLCLELRQRFPKFLFRLRPHVGEKQRWDKWIRLAKKYDLKFSDSTIELSFDFIKQCDALIVGDSNILLEAAMMDIIPLYYDSNKTHLDIYGFLSNGLTEYYSEPREVCNRLTELLQNIPSIRAKTKFYCHTVGTQYDGHSTELAASLIQTLVINPTNNNFMNNWKRISNIPIEAYEINEDNNYT